MCALPFRYLANHDKTFEESKKMGGREGGLYMSTSVVEGWADTHGWDDKKGETKDRIRGRVALT